MSRESEYPNDFALVGAGSVAASLAGRLARTPGKLGPVVAVSYRVASRIANSLKAGTPARDASVLAEWPLVLISAPADQMRALTVTLSACGIAWRGKTLIFVDCEPGPMANGPMREAAFGWIRRCPIPRRLTVGGDSGALGAALRLAGTSDRRPIVVSHELEARFNAAMLLGGAGLTPIIDSVAHVLRETGMSDKQATKAAASLFLNTVNDYSHSGRQSWDWHVHEPELDRLRELIAAIETPLGPLLRDLLLLGFERFQRHEALASALRDYDEIGEENSATSSVAVAGNGTRQRRCAEPPH